MVIAWNRVRKDARTPLAIRHCVALSVLLLVATMRGLTAPLPGGCDALLGRYGTECYLARRDVNEFGEVWFGGGEPAPGCSELRTTLDVRCVRWRGAKIGQPWRVWWAARQAERARQDDAERAERARWRGNCTRPSFRRRHATDCG